MSRIKRGLQGLLVNADMQVMMIMITRIQNMRLTLMFTSSRPTESFVFCNFRYR